MLFDKTQIVFLFLINFELLHHMRDMMFLQILKTYRKLKPCVFKNLFEVFSEFWRIFCQE